MPRRPCARLWLTSWLALPLAACTPSAPVDAVFAPAGALFAPREGHASALLPSGEVLVTGGAADGEVLTATDLFDPTSGAWSSLPDLAAPRFQHTATPLADGSVLLAGGYGYGEYLALATRFDPADAAFVELPPLPRARLGHATLALPAAAGPARALAVAGYDAGPHAEVALWDGAAWTDAPSLLTARTRHTATLLADGRVLVAGGFDGSTALASVELLAPSDFGSIAFAPGDEPGLAQARWGHTATVLPDDRVLLAGGTGASGGALSSVEVFDPTTGDLAPAAPLDRPRSGHVACLLGTGEVLVAGGGEGPEPDVTTTLYDPKENEWRLGPPLAEARTGHTLTCLPDGGALVTGGRGDKGPTASAERLAGAAAPSCALSPRDASTAPRSFAALAGLVAFARRLSAARVGRRSLRRT